MCRTLTIMDSSRGQWPVHCPLSVQSLDFQDFFLAGDLLSSFVASFPPYLRELTIGLASIDEDASLADLYDRLPVTLAALKIAEHHCMFPDDIGVHSAAALSQALVRLPHLTILHHEHVLRPDDAVHIVNGLILAQQAGKRVKMRSLTLAVSADLAAPRTQVSLVQGVDDLLVDKLSVGFSAFFGQGVASDEYKLHLLDFIRILPKPLHSLSLDMLAWPEQVMAQVMQRFASPTLQSLHINGQRRHLWSELKLEFDVLLLKECFQLSSLGRLDVQFPSLTALAIKGCLPRMAIAADSGLAASWAFPPLLRTLNLSMNQLGSLDATTIWPLLPGSLRSLVLDYNRIKSLPEPFPPLLRSLAISSNPSMDCEAPWIDALPSTLRSLNVSACNLGRKAAERLVALQQRVGMRRANSEPKLNVLVARGSRFVLDAEMKL
ncbi:hypothetical protein AMAG_16761 [Allomyces macrogynus ATCC 38327]|uniref:Uncharacterized protein n=1 Tax=Allomyces macrogynus (strain ATCC 38327) TaxID=578462 RepID=A0A0L0TBT3_ALLM3|nr:hypothetical protein AMAG_16761 [Allomyces macrogynus ATCC 38327]|eukprot:KNE72273.1 hypothetical protein AMAG_16761 [Allomyces macrogynus ATCC 38327]